MSENNSTLNKNEKAPQVRDNTTQTVDLNDVLQDLPEDKREIIQSAFYAMEHSYSGPLPPPEYCEAIEKIVPGATNRILTVFENQANHRMETEKKIVDKQFDQSHSGQIIGACLVVLFGLISFVLGIYGHDVLAGSIGVTTVVSIAVVFVLNKMPNFHKNKNTETDE